MEEKIDIWLVGNTGLRNPNRIQEGFKAFANSPYVGKLHGKENEIGFMKFLNDQGIIQNEAGKDTSGSHARLEKMFTIFRRLQLRQRFRLPFTAHFWKKV